MIVVEKFNARNFVALRFDITNPTDDSRKFLKELDFNAIPTMMIFSPERNQDAPTVITGRIGSARLLKAMASAGSR